MNSAANNKQSFIDEVGNFESAEAPDFENEYTIPNEFKQLWTYQDENGNSHDNAFLLALPVITIMIGGLGFVVFGRMK